VCDLRSHNTVQCTSGGNRRMKNNRLTNDAAAS
jgi:hypothetical protein